MSPRLKTALEWAKDSESGQEAGKPTEAEFVGPFTVNYAKYKKQRIFAANGTVVSQHDVCAMLNAKPASPAKPVEGLQELKGLYEFWRQRLQRLIRDDPRTKEENERYHRTLTELGVDL